MPELTPAQIQRAAEIYAHGKLFDLTAAFRLGLSPNTQEIAVFHKPNTVKPWEPYALFQAVSWPHIPVFADRMRAQLDRRIPDDGDWDAFLYAFQGGAISIEQILKQAHQNLVLAEVDFKNHRFPDARGYLACAANQAHLADFCMSILEQRSSR